MKKKAPYYLKMYREWMEAGRLPDNGLCCSIKNHKLLDLFELTRIDDSALDYNGKSTIYWASNLSPQSNELKRFYGMNKLRQTILLLMAAMNNEL